MTEALPGFGISICGIDELVGHCDTGASHVLSILDPEYPVPEAFGAFGEHARLELRFHDIIDPRPGLVAPEPAHVAAILELGREITAEAGEPHLLVHCHAGLSRSTAAMALILAQSLPEQPATRILQLVYRIREKAWPNLRLIEMGDAALGRGGALAEATHALHRLQMETRPLIAAFLEQEGRVREIEAARRHPRLLEPAAF